ncbi:MAG: hypothetical protein U0R44_05560 [Candidatus Micrarchaeia archaeon]
MRLSYLILACLAAFLLSSGALGLRTVSDCESDPEVTSRGDSAKIQCYHVAGITAAYVGDSSQARSICGQIYNLFGQGRSDNQRDKAELVSNTCYFDVARILREPEICGYITQNEDFGAGLFGAAVTKDTCFDEVTRLSQLAPQNYYTSNPNNICAIVFILPSILVGALKYAKPG